MWGRDENTRIVHHEGHEEHEEKIISEFRRDLTQSTGDEKPSSPNVWGVQSECGLDSR